MDFDAIGNRAIPNQRIVVFKDKTAFDAFLASWEMGYSCSVRMDGLNAMLVGFVNESDLLALLDGTEETGFNFPIGHPRIRIRWSAGWCRPAW